MGERKKLSKSVKKQLFNLLFAAILIGITITVLIVNNRELNYDNIAAFLRESNGYCIAAAFVCMLLFIAFEALSLHRITRKLGHKGRFVSSLAYSAADVYYSAITPSASGGQPASAFYMVRDGMGAGKATFALVFNLIGYTAAILVIAVSAFVINPAVFSSIDAWFARFLIIAGIVVQAVLLGFFVACMFCGGAVLKLGKKFISFLHKIRLVKKPEKWVKKLSDEVEKYRSCLAEIKKSPVLFIETLAFNVVQRVSQTLIPCFVCYAVDPSVSFADLYVLQAFVLLGYNCVPLPGGVGAYEYLYLNLYCLYFDRAFIVIAMMVSRVISYYFCIVVSGGYILVYHLAGSRKVSKEVSSSSDNAPENQGEKTHS